MKQVLSNPKPLQPLLAINSIERSHPARETVFADEARSDLREKSHAPHEPRSVGSHPPFHRLHRFIRPSKTPGGDDGEGLPLQREPVVPEGPQPLQEHGHRAVQIVEVGRGPEDGRLRVDYSGVEYPEVIIELAYVVRCT